MKEIKICFLGLGYGILNQAEVSVYDLKNNLIVRKWTVNGFLKVCLQEKCFYKIKAVSKYEILNKTIYINQSKIYIPFSSCLLCHNFNLNPITLLLTDYNYPNLPIEKGTMILG